MIVRLVVILLLLPALVHAGTFTVTNTNDAGAGSLRQAITDANASAGFDVIEMTGISGTITLTSGMLPIIMESVTIVGPGSGLLTVSGNNLYRVFFVQSGTIELYDFTIANGRARGGNAGNDAAGGGAGMGGALFVNNGDVFAYNIVFNNNQAVGGNGGTGENVFTGGGGGGMGGNGGSADIGSTGGGGGGGFQNAGGNQSAENGGNGATDSFFGGGINGSSGDYGNGGSGANGGGGGGASIADTGGNGGDGGFGGGGGGGGYGESTGGNGGNGGFGGGGGGGDFGGGGNPGNGGDGGYGGGAGAGLVNGTAGTFGGAAGPIAGAPPGGGGGAGLGGAVFVKSTGTFRMTSSSFTNCLADSGRRGLSSLPAANGSPGQGKGGAIFIEPGGIVIDYSGNSFASNTARNSGGTGSDNNNHYGTFTVFPISPVGLFAIAGNGQLTLKWRKNPEASIVRYRILMDTSSDPTTQVDSTTGGIGDTTKTITGLTNGTLYYVRVVAVDNLGQASLPSNEDAAVPVVEQGNALSFDGVDDYVVVPDSPPLNLTGDFTLSAWFKLDALDVQRLIIAKSDQNAVSAPYALFVTADNRIAMHVFNGAFNVTVGTTILETGRWYHAAGVREGTTTRIYLDGIEENSGSAPSINTNTNPLTIGGVSDFQWFAGMIDEVAIWNVAMGAGQIRASMGKPLRGDESGLVALYHADEPSGMVAYDAGRGAMDGQLINGPTLLPSGAMVPLTPRNPMITPGATNLLTWDRNVETDVLNYRIYRDTSASFITGEWIGTAPDTFFTDPRSAGGVTYYYGITAVDFVTNESDRSVTVSGQSTIGSLSVLPGLTVAFGSVNVGDSVQIPIRVYSSGGSVIVDSARLAIGAVFSRPSGSPLPDTVFAGDTLIGVFQFKPSAFTVFIDTIVVFNRSSVNPFRIVVAGTGFGNTNPFAFAVKPVGPAGLTNVPSPVLSWEGRGDPEGQTLSYIVQISETSDFASITFADTTNDTTIVVGTALSEGNYFWRVTAEDGFGGTRVSNTGFLRIDLTDPTITLGILRSTVLKSYMDVYVYADERLPSVVGTFTLGTSTDLTFVPVPGQPRLYSVPYKLTQDGTLNISVTGTDSAGNDAGLTRDYVVVGIQLNRPFTLKTEGLEIQGTGIGNGFLVARKDEAEFETGSILKNLTAVEVLADDAAGDLRLTVAYDGSTFDDERKVGLYVEREGRWQYVGGEGSGGMLSVHVSEPAFYRVMYNPDHEILPKQVELAQNYPNPFNPTTTIRFGLPEESPVRLTVFNILGQKIAELVNDDRAAGYHTVTWDGRNALGQRVASGIYLYRLETRGLVTTRKMIMLK